MDELLGSPECDRISCHCDDRLLQRAELLKSSGGVKPAGQGRLHEAMNELTREMLVEA